MKDDMSAIKPESTFYFRYHHGLRSATYVAWGFAQPSASLRVRKPESRYAPTAKNTYWAQNHNRCLNCIQSYRLRNLPIAVAVFALSGDDAVTDVSVEYSYEPKFGFLGQLMGSLMLDRQLTKGFTGFLQDLEQASQRT